MKNETSAPTSTRRKYVVFGKWPFPLDMLRHDQSRAATPEDQDMIDRLCAENPDPAILKRNVSVELVMNAGKSSKTWPNGRAFPNFERWRSFGWRVVGGDDDVYELLKVRSVLPPAPRAKDKPKLQGDSLAAPLRLDFEALCDSHDRLLAALERVVKEWVNPYDGGEFEDGEMPALDEARAAIAQARREP